MDIFWIEMIYLLNKKDCCGCTACVERCPKGCITFEEDAEGFRYPKIDMQLCVDCHLCETVCPVLNVPDAQPIHSLNAASNNDAEIKEQSSSGGVFTYIAKGVLEKGGVVFGARYDDNWEVYHDYCEDEASLRFFRGSKYMQSRIRNCYAKVEQFLKDGRKVLFTGTPCQIAGLNTFLKKKYENLITVDFICHGVPSPKVWRQYLEYLINRGVVGPTKSDITDVNFRAKIRNWFFFQILLKSESGDYIINKDDNPFFKAFNMNVLLRPICYDCPFKGGKSGSDLTIADFWGIQDIDREMYDERGTSMVVDFGHGKIDLSGLRLKQEPIETIKQCNNSFYKSSDYNGNRIILFHKMDSCRDIVALMQRCTNPTLFQRVQNWLFRKSHKK